MFRKLCLLLVLAPMALAQQGSVGVASGATPPPGELRLEDVEREVLAANPALGRAATLVAAQRAHVSQVGVLPDPTLTISWMGNPVPFEVQDNDPSSYRGLSVMQMVPLGGKRGLQREVARKDVAVEEVSESAARRDLVTAARAAFFDYCLLRRGAARSRRAISSGWNNSPKLPRLATGWERRCSRTCCGRGWRFPCCCNARRHLQQQRLTAAARLNTLMGRPAGAPLAAAAEPAASPLPAMEALAPVAEANDLMLAREARMGERERAALALSRKDGTPDLSVGYMYRAAHRIAGHVRNAVHGEPSRLSSRAAAAGGCRGRVAGARGKAGSNSSGGWS